MPAACRDSHLNGCLAAVQVVLPLQQVQLGRKQERHMQVLLRVLEGCLLVNARDRWTMQQVTSVLFAQIHGSG